MQNKPCVDHSSTQNTSWRLVADIGGTNARFALADEQGVLQRQETLRCDAYNGPAEAIQHYLSKHSVNDIRAAAIAVATAVHEDRITFTNRASWSFSRRELGQQLGVKDFHVINDFTALALAIPRLGSDSLVPVSPNGRGEPQAPRAVIGPGTGLGVSGVLRVAGHWHALDGEGGHTTLAPADTREMALLTILSRHFGHVSAERVLSGAGLVNLYQANCELAGVAAQDLTPADITERGLAKTCSICMHVLEDFCSMLGTTTGNLVLTLGARGGAYIGGGIVPRLQSMLGNSRFRERFEAHGRLSNYLAGIPCYIVTARYPALEGTLSCLNII